ncbi:MAG: DsrE family protein [Bacteroidales bacterium]|nr:DsrE family protein [Bacteroidales bacterium]
MKKIFLMIAAAAILVSCQQRQGSKNDHGQMSMKTDSVAACCASKDGLFIHLSSGYENPHKALMALKMAVMMSEHQDVLVYVDIKGVDLLLKSSKDLKYKDFPTLYELLDQLAQKKVTVMACPACMKAAGYKQEDLRGGIILAQKDKFFNFTKGKIVTLDY